MPQRGEMEAPSSQHGTPAAGTCLGKMFPGDSSHCYTAKRAAQCLLPSQTLKEAEDCWTAEENLINVVSHQTHEQRW